MEPVRKERCSPVYIKALARVGAKYSAARDQKERDSLKAFQFFSQSAQYGHAGSNYEVLYPELTLYSFMCTSTTA